LLKVKKGNVHFDKVEFGYDGKKLFDGLDLNIKEGEKIGLVGPSGAGKSSLVQILLRLYDIDGGAIKIDGQDIRHVDQDSLRRNIAVIPQMSDMLHRTIRENILYGRLDASEEEVIEAAKRAKAHDFIMELIDQKGNTGYDSLVGERGVKLSGGQRQRVAIARAILKDAPILVLDEATSALDSESERAIQESLESLMQGKTVLAIAHRLSTIAHMDRLIIMHEGQIIEEGTHEELLKLKDGHYARLWSMQSGGFLKQ
jgi:ABC-type multidrug transport system fused ATPase/permease subunit